MEFFGENWVKPNLVEAKRLGRRYAEFKDEIYRIHWTVIYDNEMYFIFKIGLYDDCHEGEGVAQTTECFDVIFEIKYEYEIHNDILNENIDLGHMERILNFIDEVCKLCGFNSFDKGVYEMRKQLEEAKVNNLRGDGN